jgi:arginine decarboxylase
MHNLFGDTHSVDVKRETGGGYRISDAIQGDTVAKILRYVNFEPEDLVRAYTKNFAASGLPASQQDALLSELTSGLSGYTYLEE